MSQQSPQMKTSWRFSLKSALIAVAFFSLFMTLVHFGNQANKIQKRYSTTNDFRQIALSILTFYDVRKQFPHPIRYSDGVDSSFAVQQDPNAKPLYSWRFAIIPFIGSYKLGPAFDQTWNSPANAQWRTFPQPFAYDGWIHGVFDTRPRNSIPTETCAFAITGPGTAFGEVNAISRPSLEGIDVDTIIVVETRNSGIHWMQPGDFDIRTIPRTINDPSGKGISSKHKTGFHVIFADATVWYLSNEVPFEQLAKFFTIEGAKAHDRYELLGPYLYE